VTDIDRGGAFAHLYGTWALLPEVDRRLIKGFVLNKFRGDASLLAPAPQMLQDLTGVPTVATIPMQWHHGLPEEDGVFDDRTRVAGAVNLTVAVVAYPRISNLDEFQPLKNAPGVKLVWARTPADLTGVDWVILPGSKSTVADLAWLRQQGLDAAVCAHAARGGAVLGICGGLQMLGEGIVDPLGVEGGAGPTHALAGDAPGLGLLPLVTAFGASKAVRRTHTQFRTVTGAWCALSGVAVSGYEIHLGQTAQHPAMAAIGDVAVPVLPDGLGWQNQQGNVLGVYLHGVFEDPAVLGALLGFAPPSPGCRVQQPGRSGGAVHGARMVGRTGGAGGRLGLTLFGHASTRCGDSMAASAQGPVSGLHGFEARLNLARMAIHLGPLHWPAPLQSRARPSGR
jgi:adenosylcobyric acid synthase